MVKQICFLIQLVFCILLVFDGCGTPAPKKFSSDAVHVYAELLVMHEKEKISGFIPDSVYRRHVNDFFVARKINAKDFEKQISEISRDDGAWREFLNETTTVVDSIKAGRLVQH